MHKYGLKPYLCIIEAKHLQLGSQKDIVLTLIKTPRKDYFITVWNRIYA